MNFLPIRFFQGSHRNGPRLLATMLLLLVMVVCVEGCGRHSGPPRWPVRGRVTLQGKPVNGGSITFENLTMGVAVVAPLDINGEYEMKTYNTEGLPAGTYCVAVTSQLIVPPQPLDDQRPMIPTTPPRNANITITPIPVRYHALTSSGLTATIQSDEDRRFDFDLVP